MLKKAILASVFIVFVFASFAAGKVKYIPLQEFGIRVATKGFYSKVGRTFTGRVTDPVKLHYTNDIFRNVSKGDRVKVTNLGNGKVKVKNQATGEAITIEVRAAYSEDEVVYTGMADPVHREIGSAGRADLIPSRRREIRPRPSFRPVIPKPQFEVTQDVDSVVTAIKTRFSSEEIRQIVRGLKIED